MSDEPEEPEQGEEEEYYDEPASPIQEGEGEEGFKRVALWLGIIVVAAVFCFWNDLVGLVKPKAPPPMPQDAHAYVTDGGAGLSISKDAGFATLACPGTAVVSKCISKEPCIMVIRVLVRQKVEDQWVDGGAITNPYGRPSGGCFNQKLLAKTERTGYVSGQEETTITNQAEAK